MRAPKLRFKEFKGDWEEKRLGELLSYEQPKKYIVKSTRYSNQNTIPVLTAGKSFILGFTDESNNIFLDVPVIIFDDFTTSIQYVDFPFKVKSSALKILKPKIEVNIKVVYELMTKIDFCIGDSHKRRWISEYQNLQIHLPPLPEQTKIASFLTSIDSKIEFLSKKDESLKNYKKGIMQKIFNQEIRFKKDDGSDFEDWEEKRLGEFLKERNVMLEKSTTYKHFSLTVDGVVEKKDRYNRDFLVRGSGKLYKLTKINDICYNPANLKFGVISRNKLSDGVFSPIYVTFEVVNVMPEFIEYFLKRKCFIERIRCYEEGTVYERKAVKVVDFIKFFVFIPPLPEQTKIASFLTSVDSKINLLQKQISLTKDFKKSLLQQMFV